MDKELYWSQTLERMRLVGDSEIEDWRKSGQDLLYSPHGILRHQRTARQLLDIQRATGRKRLDELLTSGAESLSQTIANKISGNTIAYTMYQSPSAEVKAKAVEWASAEEEIGHDDVTPSRRQIITHPDFSKGEFSQLSTPSFTIEDVPTKELQRRLQRGEIIPRNDWIPSEDLDNRKSISAADARSRIDFGEKLRTEATGFMDRYKELQKTTVAARSQVGDGGGGNSSSGGTSFMGGARDRALTSPSHMKQHETSLGSPTLVGGGNNSHSPSRRARLASMNQTFDADDVRPAAPLSFDRNTYQIECANLVSRANVLYTQGCNLLKYYICEENLALGMEMEDLLRTFRHNAAVTHLKLREFRSCIKVCDEGIYFDNHDGKLCWLKAKAYEELGDLRFAMSLYRELSEDGYASASHREAASEAWKKAAALQRASDLKEGKLVKNWYLEESQLANGDDTSPLSGKRLSHNLPLFDDDRTTAANSPSSGGASSPFGSRSMSKQTTTTTTRTTSPSVKSRPQRLDIKPLMAPERFIQLLQDMTRLYTSPPNLARFESIRAEADYDEKQIILKLRKFLPSILQPLFVKYEVPGSSYEEMKRSYDQLEYEVQVSSQVSDRLRGLVRYHLDNLREITLSS